MPIPSLQEVVYRAEIIANGVANDPKKSILVDGDYTAETIFPHAVRYVLNCEAKDGGNLNDLITEHTIALTAGAGVLPSTVLKKYLDEAYLSDQTFAAMLPYEDFNRPRTFDTQMKYWTVKGSVFKYSDATAVSVKLVVASMPDLSGITATDPLPLSLEVVEDVIATIADVLRGSLPLSKLTEEQ